MKQLPIDEILPQLLNAIKDHPAVVVQAPPGAGKTTKVPLALLDAIPGDQKIIMLEPRRLAVTNACRWMASLLGEEVGKTVGYTIRFERKVSPATRIEIVTEGILTRRLQSGPLLSGVALVIFDEFHERSLNSDLALALCRDAQLGLRPELKIIVMSATLDAAPIATLLGDAPLLTSEGRSYPVELRYQSREAEGRTAETMSVAIRKALKETEGDILAFLPGAGEINRCLSLLQGPAAEVPGSVLLYPLYGDLPFEQQEKAILPGASRKVVLATNIAETSLTIEGIRVVIDSGLCRQLRFEAATGLNRLLTTRISAASATQRAGRAGRTAPGVCYRLWTEHIQSTLVPFTVPEICSTDLSSLALELALWGINDPSDLSWLDIPPAAALAEGRGLLKTLGALDRGGLITGMGRRMALLPVHPRLAHLITAGKERGYASLACDIAALLTERDLVSARSLTAQTSDSDILNRIELLESWRQGNSSSQNLARADIHGFRVVDRLARQLLKLIGQGSASLPTTVEAVGLLLALAYPDRIAQQREPESSRYLLANGRGGALSVRSALSGNSFIVAVVMEGGEKGDGQIHSATSFDVSAIRREFAADIQWLRVVTWDERLQRVIAREEERFGALVLAMRQITPAPDEMANALLEGVGSAAGLAALNWTPQVEQFCARVCFLARIFPEQELPDFSAGNLLRTLPRWLGPYVSGIRSLAQLHNVDLLQPLKNMLSREQLHFLQKEAPTHLLVPSGSSIALEYAEDKAPVLAVKLQEMFGLADTPKIAGGRVAVILHLLSPARRPIQVTQDLKNFWNSTYIEVKKELKGRYPKHPWPDDPWNAVPTRKAKSRG